MKKDEINYEKFDDTYGSAMGQRVGEITVDEMELHLTLTLDLGRQGYRENAHQVSGRRTFGFGGGTDGQQGA